ncbi:hypothetical protein EMIHUDRAFT_199367 [Emiliania huxleyi CCMP1516]|uniref:Uncharacterized protein n=2 Tax=Emiliania huxleyi TaxID=2903 RepID=A0A0D3KZG6_EMIH1|nr:hypothetical protein EMIHUDRAFT_199367 [Emiliania huxleyi CCMP1516]EOD41151.1 hypothetical protein EMIHUDRAFT_199367 [Emiliania huxleyi CCMP1516]|eukprot:XP_005793580.1 hypothetical protein EMIHUDRAFT_199367 [Emiliania huxleyi CCMP1516]
MPRDLEAGAGIHLLRQALVTAKYSAGYNGDSGTLLSAPAGSLSCLELARGHEPCVRLLVVARAAVDLESASGFTALKAAVQEGRADCVRVLCEGGADVELASPLRLAAFRGHDECCAALLHARADLTCRSATGLTALHVAAQQGAAGCCSLLCEGGAEIDAADDKGWTPMLVAVLRGHLACAAALSSFGASRVGGRRLAVAEEPRLEAEAVAETRGWVELHAWLLLWLGAAARHSRRLPLEVWRAHVMPHLLLRDDE